MRSCLLCLFLLASALGRPHFEAHHNSSTHFFGGHRDPLLVHTTSGRVRGFLRTVGDKEIRVFYGIPYARPPIGDLRFRRPQPVEPWPHIFHADELPNSCYQASILYIIIIVLVCVGASFACHLSPTPLLFTLERAFSAASRCVALTCRCENAALRSRSASSNMFSCASCELPCRDW